MAAEGRRVASGRVVRVVQKLLGGAATLLVVPTLVNVGTGGTAPPWLAPYTGWTWPVAGTCVLVIAALELIEPRGSVRDAISARRADDPRNVDRALDQVARYVDLRQRNSLAERVRIALALDERPDAVRQPVHLVQRVGGGRFEVREAGEIAAVYEELSGSMLVLGAPGAGKSTQLLDLAERLIADGRARRTRDPASVPPVPVVVDLAEWSRSGTRRFRLPRRRRSSAPVALSAWLGSVLRERYGIPPLVTAAWLADDRLALLLDGLDEVRESDRERCVQEINGLQDSVTRLVVCSRTADYAVLRGRLRLQGAVEIQPFRADQVAAFLSAVSPQLRGVADALAADEELWDMLTTPLMLNIMALAYGEGSAPSVPADGDPETRRRLLFDAYVVEVLARHRARAWRAGIERTLHSLRNLARLSGALNAGVQVVRPSGWYQVSRGFEPDHRRILTGWLAVAGGCTCAVVVSATIAAHAGYLLALPVGVLAWGVAALYLDEARIVASEESPTTFRHVLLLAWSAALAATVHLVTWILVTATEWLLPVGWAGLRPPVTALLAGLIVLTAWVVLVAGPTGGPDSSLRAVDKNRVLVVLVWATGVGVLAIALVPPWTAWWFGPVVLTTALVGSVVGFFLGFVIMESLTLPLCRVVMLLAGEPDPWRRGLLRFAADRSLLSFVDTEYRFVHLLVRDHLAACDPPTLAAAVAARRDQLTASTVGGDPGRTASTP